ncbi:Serine carboxypeptidase-like 34, putative [Theobroma cacao]|uniref:Serine carboxypeptidase-like 34, putative n=1 Tax=Theobroma cacao TaxID=3641 RepID=A0A061E253_THECC|nr:Serine carboxypeptidase-like 34, putative [Theobroma cacao]
MASCIQLLLLNQYTANLLFLDSPAVVGFSYSNKTLDFQGDNSTALDSFTFLQNWFKRFPQYKSSEFYIAGESYAVPLFSHVYGHYVPQLAEDIFDENKKSTKENYINLKGFIIGNALMDEETDQIGMIDYAWGHALISDALYKAVKVKCNFSTPNLTDECRNEMLKYFQLYQLIDMYSLNSPICTVDPPFNVPNQYSDVNNAWKDWRFSLLPVLKNVIDGGIRVWIYSNGICISFFLSCDLKIIEDWTPWNNHKEVGGWTIRYEGLSSITVREAGHHASSDLCSSTFSSMPTRSCHPLLFSQLMTLHSKI